MRRSGRAPRANASPSAPDGHEESGAFRRDRADAPTVGHQFATHKDGVPVSWAVVEQPLGRDGGEPFLESTAERDQGARSATR
jgi:hypothetical protein